MIVELPEEDRVRSPYTGWTREHWAAIADHMLLSLRPWFSSSRSRVSLPGRTSISGVDSDGLEGFARSFLLYAFRTAGEHGVDPHGFTGWYRDGLLAGTDPIGPERWPVPVPSRADQSQVEAASIVVGLQLTRPWLWDTLAPHERQRVIDWLAKAPLGRYYDNNWRWFRITIETFLASVGGPHDPGRVLEDLAAIESYYRGGGWYADGDLRAYDHYCGWAMHVYPLLWTRSPGAEAFGSRALEPVFRGRLADFLDDYVHLIGADGMPVIEGRSLVYRFATAAPLWMGAVTGAARLSPGAIRRAASGVLRAFIDRGALDDRGLLTLGLYGAWPQLAQPYSGAGSPYWASKGMLGLLLPADHEVWRATEEPLPVETGDTRRVIRSAGWMVSGTRSDGIVRLYNHGTDHELPGARGVDSPIYARFGYSSATMPPPVGDTVYSPVDNSVGALRDGQSTHRTGFKRGVLGDDGTAVFATSVAHMHWVDPGDAGLEPRVVDGSELHTASVVRGAWEVRAARLAHDAPSTRLRVSGWPIPSVETAQVRVDDATAVRVEADGLIAELVSLSEGAHPSAHEERGTSPLGEVTTVPWLEFDVAAGETVVVASRLARETASADDPPRTRLLPCSVLEVSWADGATSTVTMA